MPDLPVLSAAPFPELYRSRDRRLVRALSYEHGKAALAASKVDGTAYVAGLAALHLTRLNDLEERALAKSVVGSDRIRLICDTAACGMAATVQRLSSGF